LALPNGPATFCSAKARKSTPVTQWLHRHAARVVQVRSTAPPSAADISLETLQNTACRGGGTGSGMLNLRERYFHTLLGHCPARFRI
jgi:hypothetical protein